MIDESLTREQLAEIVIALARESRRLRELGVAQESEHKYLRQRVSGLEKHVKELGEEPC